MVVNHALLYAGRRSASEVRLPYSHIHYAGFVESAFYVHLSCKAEEFTGFWCFHSFYFSKVLLDFSILKVPFCWSLTSPVLLRT